MLVPAGGQHLPISEQHSTWSGSQSQGRCPHATLCPLGPTGGHHHLSPAVSEKPGSFPGRNWAHRCHLKPGVPTTGLLSLSSPQDLIVTGQHGPDHSLQLPLECSEHSSPSARMHQLSLCNEDFGPATLVLDICPRGMKICPHKTCTQMFTALVIKAKKWEAPQVCELRDRHEAAHPPVPSYLSVKGPNTDMNPKSLC